MFRNIPAIASMIIASLYLVNVSVNTADGYSKTTEAGRASVTDVESLGKGGLKTEVGYEY